MKYHLERFNFGYAYTLTNALKNKGRLLFICDNHFVWDPIS